MIAFCAAGELQRIPDRSCAHYTSDAVAFQMQEQEKDNRRWNKSDLATTLGAVVKEATVNRSIGHALVTYLALAPALTAACLTGSVTCFVPRTPHGIYADVNVQMYLNDYQNMYHTAAPANYFSSTVYPGLLGNPDISGIVLYVKWSKLNPNPAPSPLTPPGHFQYDWSLVQDLLDQAGTLKKTVQLVVTPGLNSPTWLLGDVDGKNDGLLKSCNYLFSTVYKPPPAGTECGKVTFKGFDEGGYNKTTMAATDQDVPMPWDSTYKNAWQTFLTALAAQFGSNPSLVSIAVAGPTASSEEMILPTSQNTYGGKEGPYSGNGGPQLGGYTAEQMWAELLKNHYTSSAYKDYTKYLNSDVAFIDEWEHAIDMFGKTFSGLTLTMSTGDGLPNLTGSSSPIPTSPIDFTTVCLVANMDCAAETTILAYFIQSTVGGPNAKATMTDGMKGGAKHGNLSVPNVKLISGSTDLYTSPSQRILGGAQFATKFSTTNSDKGISDEGNSDEGGCPSTCTAEQAEYNVLVWFFDGTSQGPNFPTGSVPKVGGASGSAPLNYLQIYGPDITYASTDAFGKVPVMMGGTPTYVSAQDLLHKASLALALIAEQ